MAVRKKFPYQAALVACNGGCEAGKEACTYGCTGCGSCVNACRFGAAAINERGTAEISEDLCTACGACVRACPRQIIHIHECANYIVVKCSNREKGPLARQQCPRSCIGCGLCERSCTAGAIRVVENCAVVEEAICLSCGMCAVKCPRGAIYDLRGILAAGS